MTVVALIQQAKTRREQLEKELKTAEESYRRIRADWVDKCEEVDALHEVVRLLKDDNDRLHSELEVLRARG